MPNKELILILSTRQNHVWKSMEEIIPLIEKQWSYSLSEKFEVKTIIVDDKKPSQYLSYFLRAKKIIFTAFNHTLSQWAVILREDLKIHTDWFVYLHNQATIGMWPYYYFKMGDYFHSGDVFLGTCEGDRESLKLVLPEACFEKIYFPYIELSSGESLNLDIKDGDLVFVGRVSPQKNLHFLIWALGELKSEGRNKKLHIFGEEDHLGSPNMGIQNKNYKKLLEKMIKALSLEDSVKFHGFQKRENLHTTLKNNKVLWCFPSTHSDENFGMSLMRALVEGHQVLATLWGGHLEHSFLFSEKFIGLKVFQNGVGPFLSIKELSDKIKGWEPTEIKPQLPKLLNIDSAKSVIESLVGRDNGTTYPLKKSLLIDNLLQQVESFKSHKLGQCFSSYEDEKANLFFKAYGGVEKKLEIKKSYKFSPWVNKAEVQDPIRGNFSFEESMALNTGAIKLEE